MPITDTEIATALAPAGLHFVERVRGGIHLPLPPTDEPIPGRQTWDGMIRAKRENMTDIFAFRMVEDINTSWFGMGAEYGLFTERREFAITIEHELEYGWVHVRLMDEWDIAGSGVSLLSSGTEDLDTTRFVPGFDSVSLDGRTMVSVINRHEIVSTYALRPDDPLQTRLCRSTWDDQNL